MKSCFGLLRTTAAAAVVLFVTCGKPPVVRPPVVFPPECVIFPGPADAENVVTVALLQPVRAEHAPAPLNPGEQFLFGLAYETLITIDCLGQVHAGLARSYQKSEGGRRWTFELHENAKFWDGSPVTSLDVAESWLDAAVRPVTRNAVIDSTVTDGERVLHVYFKERCDEVPRFLSSRAFAVTKPSSGSRWPLGSGSYRITSTTLGSPDNSRQVITAYPAFDRELPDIQFLVTSTQSARDLMEDKIDVMVTSDPDVLEYARSRPRFVTRPLPWERTHVLVATSRVRELLRGAGLAAVTPGFRARLARDAVRGDSRGFEPPPWWKDFGRCAGLTDSIVELPPVSRDAYSFFGSRRILYQAEDETARDLAERIVALAGADPAGSRDAAVIGEAVPDLVGLRYGPRADGVTRYELGRSLRGGDDFAYVIAVTRRPADPCFEARLLVDGAPWLAAPDVDLSESLIPLVDSRLHVIADSSAVALILDWSCNVLVVNGNQPER